MEEGTKPPLGLKPRKFWLEERRNEIVLAMSRYITEGKPIPFEWVEELSNLLTKELAEI